MESYKSKDISQEQISQSYKGILRITPLDDDSGTYSSDCGFDDIFKNDFVGEVVVCDSIGNETPLIFGKDEDDLYIKFDSDFHLGDDSVVFSSGTGVLSAETIDAETIELDTIKVNTGIQIAENDEGSLVSITGGPLQMENDGLIFIGDSELKIDPSKFYFTHNSNEINFDLGEQVCSPTDVNLMYYEKGKSVNVISLKKVLSAFGILGSTDTIAEFYKIGDIKYTLSPKSSGGWIPCDGRRISKTTYSALREYLIEIGYLTATEQAKTNFAVPDMRNRFVRCGSTKNDIGKTQEASLPNITGRFICDDISAIYATTMYNAWGEYYPFVANNEHKLWGAFKGIQYVPEGYYNKLSSTWKANWNKTAYKNDAGNEEKYSSFMEVFSPYQDSYNNPTSDTLKKNYSTNRITYDAKSDISYAANATSLNAYSARMTIDASRCSNVYGKDSDINEVRPNSIYLYAYIFSGNTDDETEFEFGNYSTPSSS